METHTNDTQPIKDIAEEAFVASAREERQKREAAWRDGVFAWIDPAPVWVGAACWAGWVSDRFPPDPTDETDRIHWRGTNPRH
jgi:hypothetical protein